MKLTTKKLLSAAKKFIRNAAPQESYGKLSVYIPKSVEDISFQAKQLKQCLISCEYDKKMMDGKCILIFVRGVDGNPIATCEVAQDASIVQFRGDESDIYKCDPPKEAVEAVGAYLKSIRKSRKEAKENERQ